MIAATFHVQKPRSLVNAISSASTLLFNAQLILNSRGRLQIFGITKDGSVMIQTTVTLHEPIQHTHTASVDLISLTSQLKSVTQNKTAITFILTKTHLHCTTKKKNNKQPTVETTLRLLGKGLDAEEPLAVSQTAEQPEIKATAVVSDWLQSLRHHNSSNHLVLLNWTSHHAQLSTANQEWGQQTISTVPLKSAEFRSAAKMPPTTFHLRNLKNYSKFGNGHDAKKKEMTIVHVCEDAMRYLQLKFPFQEIQGGVTVRLFDVSRDNNNPALILPTLSQVKRQHREEEEQKKSQPPIKRKKKKARPRPLQTHELVQKYRVATACLPGTEHRLPGHGIKYPPSEGNLEYSEEVAKAHQKNCQHRYCQVYSHRQKHMPTPEEWKQSVEKLTSECNQKNLLSFIHDADSYLYLEWNKLHVT